MQEKIELAAAEKRLAAAVEVPEEQRDQPGVPLVATTSPDDAK